MKSPRELRAWAAVKYRTGHRRWLVTPFEELTFTTGVPTETDVASDPDAVAEWVGAWGAFERADHPGVDLEWVTRHWTSFGDQVLPIRVRVGGADQLALLAGRGEDWSSLVDRTDQLRAAWPDADGLPSALASLAGRLRGLGAEEVPKLLAVVNWLVAHPESGLLRRQLPIEGVDTKWFERHSDLVQRLVEALSGSGGLGLRIDPLRFRVRILDETLAPHLPRDFTVPAAELMAMTAPERGVLICENVQSVAALPSIPGVVAIHGQGLAVPELAMVPWISVARVFYWGDLDTHGFRILSLLRQVLPGVQSVLMDSRTLERYRAFAVPEPSPYRTDITHLTSSETIALRAIRDGDLRLEQERIDIGFAEEAVRALIGVCPPG